MEICSFNYSCLHVGCQLPLTTGPNTSSAYWFFYKHWTAWNIQQFQFPLKFINIQWEWSRIDFFFFFYFNFSFSRWTEFRSIDIWENLSIKLRKKLNVGLEDGVRKAACLKFKRSNDKLHRNDDGPSNSISHPALSINIWPIIIRSCDTRTAL